MIYNIIEKISNTSSTNEKIEILKQNKDNEVLKKILLYTYSPLINYYVKDFYWNREPNVAYLSKEHIFQVLDRLSSRTVTGNAAREELSELARELEPYAEREILAKIINRDLDCGINVKSINKVFPNLIPTVPYMRCSGGSEIDRIKYPAIIQRKADGIFCNAVIRNGKVKFFTRNGTEFSLDKIGNVVERFGKFGDFNDEGIVLNGELLVTDDEGYEISRKEGNGLINSLIKKDQTLESLRVKAVDAKSLRAAAKLNHEIETKELEYSNTDVSLKYVVWDIIPYDEWVQGEYNMSYGIRLAHLKVSMEAMGEYGCFRLIETREVSSVEEAQEFYKEQIEKGYEGAILKNLNGSWKNHTSPNQVKMKAEHDCDLKIIGFEEGTGKYIGQIGSLICVSSDEKLKVNVGSGLTDADREKDFSELFGKIITVKYNEVITSESKDTKSLFLPRVAELVRGDKTEADSLEKILKG
jgi:ATP-dependent DNA ligase